MLLKQIGDVMKKILIVDDEQDIVESLKFVLEGCDYTCYCAYNGEDGLKLAREIVPDLIILDVMMPRINGYKISRLLKFDSKYKDIPILMVTARTQEEDKLIGEETGANEYITKPFDLDDVLKTVQKYLEPEAVR
jgi:DNA-binding response OmpR family regulator